MDAKNNIKLIKGKISVGRTKVIVQGKHTTACMGWLVDGYGGQCFDALL
jgi:hypothetical protein